MAFRFRLETVLRHRGRIVEEKSREVALAETRLNQLQDQLLEIERDLAQAYAEAKLPDGTPLHLGDLLAKRRWLEHLGNRKYRMEELRDKAMNIRNESRHHLEEAWRQHEVLDRLRTRRKADHESRVTKVETQIMDEIASLRHPSSRSAITSGRRANLAGA